ncbi:MAG: ATP synthase subunit I [Pseudomonadota bacterium]
MFFGLGLQAAVVLLVVLVYGLRQDGAAALAAAYGGAVAVLNGVLLVWRWHQGRRDYHCDGQRHLRAFHRSALERFFVVGLLLAAGIAGLHLDPPPLLIGFIAGQIAWVFLAATRKFE